MTVLEFALLNKYICIRRWLKKKREKLLLDVDRQRGEQTRFCKAVELKETQCVKARVVHQNDN